MKAYCVNCGYSKKMHANNETVCKNYREMPPASTSLPAIMFRMEVYKAALLVLEVV